MLATFIIALREGLEASLIVGIIAAFLRKNGKPLTAMWLGVILAVLLSLLVGVLLDMTERALPQTEQEGMESVIGLVAVFFVTGMILWMNTHARSMKHELENEAADALSKSSTWALASMAFLAVLKEGFETCVFLLATFSVAQSTALATLGAGLGLLLAVVIGWGIYIGGIRLNLARFFRFTGLFLILVAAGLVISSLRSAHEAGWLNVGQERVANLSWLVTPGTVQSALISGILGIPADPRMAEFIGWIIYIGVVALLLFWPASLRPAPAASARLRCVLGLALTLAAAALFFAWPTPGLQLPATVALVGRDTDSHPIASASLQQGTAHDYRLVIQPAAGKERVVALPDASARADDNNGISSRHWTVQYRAARSDAPSVLSLDDVVALYGNRVPVGLSPSQHPGPYQALWAEHCTLEVQAARGVLLNVTGTSREVVTLSGSGLAMPRTFTVNHDGENRECHWQTSEAWHTQVLAALSQMRADQDAWRFWARMLPAILIVLAMICVFSGGRLLLDRRKGHQQEYLA